MRNAGHALSKDQIADHVWDTAFEGNLNVVEVYIRYLRLKIDAPFGLHSIETLRGVGYRLMARCAPAPSSGADRFPQLLTAVR
jgi:two-component system OmpR family response regulator